MNSIEDFREQLASKEELLLKDYYRMPKSTKTMIKNGILGNTFRAYRDGETHVKYKPSSIFRKWAFGHLSDPAFKKALESSSDFEGIHKNAVQSLETFWKKNEPDAPQLEFFHFTKLVDLLFKHFPNWRELPENRRKFFFDRIHVPLDKYSLSALIQFVNPESLGLNKNPSMNSVKGEYHYHQLQQTIKELVAPKPPILFDIYAWNYLRLETEEPGDFELEEIKKKK